MQLQLGKERVSALVGWLQEKARCHLPTVSRTQGSGGAHRQLQSHWILVEVRGAVPLLYWLLPAVVCLLLFAWRCHRNEAVLRLDCRPAQGECPFLLPREWRLRQSWTATAPSRSGLLPLWRQKRWTVPMMIGPEAGLQLYRPWQTPAPTAVSLPPAVRWLKSGLYFQGLKSVPAQTVTVRRLPGLLRVLLRRFVGAGESRHWQARWMCPVKSLSG